MVEALTSKNLELGERCGELEATIADLESSVELSEELESQQAEEIRELQVRWLTLCSRRGHFSLLAGSWWVLCKSQHRCHLVEYAVNFMLLYIRCG